MNEEILELLKASRQCVWNGWTKGRMRNGAYYCAVGAVIAEINVRKKENRLADKIMAILESCLPDADKYFIHATLTKTNIGLVSVCVNPISMPFTLRDRSRGRIGRLTVGGFHDLLFLGLRIR